MTAYLLLLLILLVQTPPSVARPTMQALDLTPSSSGGGKLMRRSAGPQRVGVAAKRAAQETIWLGSRLSQKPLIVDSEGGLRVTKQDHLTSDTWFNIPMVLNFSTGKPLLLPGENRTDSGEFKFFIRSQQFQFYVCIRADGEVYTLKVHDNRLSEDCLWRGRVQSDLSDSTGKRRTATQVTMITFYRALNPMSTATEEELAGEDNTVEASGSRTNSRLYLSFAPDGGAPLNARQSSQGSQSTRVMAIEEFRSDLSVKKLLADVKPTAGSANSDSAANSDAVEVANAGLVRVETQSLNAATRQRLIESEAVGQSQVAGICSAAAAAAAAHATERWTKNRQVLCQLQRMRIRLRALIGPEGIRLVNQYLVRDLALGFLDDEAEKATARRRRKHRVVQRRKQRHQRYRRRFRCRRDLLTLAFQSSSVARRLIELDCPEAAVGGARARRQRQRRRNRIRRSLLRLLRPAGGCGAARGCSVLAALRNVLNMSLPSHTEIREALLRRRVQRDERRRILAAEPEARDLSERLEQLRLEDSVMFAQAVRHSRPDRLLERRTKGSRNVSTKSKAQRQLQQLKKKKKKRPLLTMKQLVKLREKWKNFPKFYYNICSN